MTTVRCLGALSPVLALLIVEPLQAVTPLTLEAFAARLAARPIDGQPLKAFEDFRKVAGASDFAATVLSEKAKAAQWSNAVFALGAIGDQKAREVLDAFFRNPNDPLTGTHRLSPTTFNAKIDSIFAFGYMALHSPDDQVKSDAKLFLDKANGPTGDLWRDIQWQSPYHPTPAARNAYLLGKVRLVMKAIAAQSRPAELQSAAMVK